MTKGILQGPPGNPFPPTIIEAEAIVAVGVMFAHIFILLVMMILMIYYSKEQRLRKYPTLIVIYLFSLIIGFESFLHLHTPFSPIIEVFMVIFNTSVFIQCAIDYYTLRNIKKEQ